MTGESEPSLISYVNVLSDERAKLEAKESQIATLLITELGVGSDVCWIATEDSRHRTIRLMITGETPRMVFEVSEIELAELAPAELLDELRHAIRRA